ncbi:hypothetical protein GO281_04777 [Ralstonia solanacearum]|nr:hypothetical protein CJO83_03330 [Ralstonia solanacearum]BEU50503.1 hypothetical protein MAFF211520_07950 [Ralstonia pseudosolanacearum]AXW42168.1 hypothetical protein CJO90_03330 [Ralstonia solanacearum]AXW65477.1 hypothetical protein CJO95_03325 [Ralstonia solanacearum]NKA60995.1 hypothetical protein [Ralstonia solanacearum]
MQVDLDVLRNLNIARVTTDKTHYVRMVDIPQPFRAEFRAWMFLGQCPAIDGEDSYGCKYEHDFEGYRQERLTGIFRKWRGTPPWELSHYRSPEDSDQQLEQGER